MEVSIAVIKDAQNSLYFQLRAKDPYKGFLGLVGGKVEKGETNESCLRREVYEESKLTLKKVEYLGTVEEQLSKGSESITVNLHIFVATTNEQAVGNQEEGKMVCVSREEFIQDKERFIPTDWLITEKVLNNENCTFAIKVEERKGEYEITSIE